MTQRKEALAYRTRGQGVERLGTVPLTAHTARMGYTGSDWLDVTQGGNIRRDRVDGEKGGHRRLGLAFAPSRSLLQPFMQKRQSNNGVVTDEDWADYVERYTIEMRISYRHQRPTWGTLLSWEHVVLLCFCPDPNRCHRRVLAGILVKLGAVDGGELLVIKKDERQLSLLW